MIEKITWEGTYVEDNWRASLCGAHASFENPKKPVLTEYWRWDPLEPRHPLEPRPAATPLEDALERPLGDVREMEPKMDDGLCYGPGGPAKKRSQAEKYEKTAKKTKAKQTTFPKAKDAVVLKKPAKVVLNMVKKEAVFKKPAQNMNIVKKPSQNIMDTSEDTSETDTDETPVVRKKPAAEHQ